MHVALDPMRDELRRQYNSMNVFPVMIELMLCQVRAFLGNSMTRTGEFVGIQPSLDRLIYILKSVWKIRESQYEKGCADTGQKIEAGNVALGNRS